MTLAVAGATTATSASRASRTCRTSPGRSHSDVWAGFPVSAANVSGPMNRVAASVRTTDTSAPAALSKRATSAALYAAIPPETPSTTRRPASGSLLGLGLLGSLVVDLPFGDLLERDRERLVREAGFHERGHELTPALAELVVVRVDLSRPLGGHDHQGVLRIHGGEQVVDLGLDHRRPSFVLRRAASARCSGGSPR